MGAVVKAVAAVAAVALAVETFGASTAIEAFAGEALAEGAAATVGGDIFASEMTASVFEAFEGVEAVSSVAEAVAANPGEVLAELSTGALPTPDPMTLEQAIEIAEQGAENFVPEVTPEDFAEDLVPDLDPNGDLNLPPSPIEQAPMIPPEAQPPGGLPESGPAAPQAPALPEGSQSILPGESSGIPTGKMKPGLASLANYLGAPVEMVEALQNPIVNNMVSSAMQSGLRGKSLEDTIENALVSGAGGAAGMLGTEFSGSKLVGDLANYATKTTLRGGTPNIEGFLGTAAVRGGLNALSTDLPDWTKPVVETAGNYLSGQVGQALSDSPTPKQAAPVQPVRITAGTPTGRPTAADGTLGTQTGSGLPTSLIQKQTPTDFLSAPQFGQILGEESGLTNTPIRYGNQFQRPLLAQSGLSSTLPENQQLDPLFAGLTDEQASLVSGGLTGQNTNIDPALQRLMLARGYAMGGVVDMVPGPEDRLYRRHMKRGFAVNGPGTGQSDDIPTMLADGEYVIDADTVAQLGDGSSKAGAQILDKFREEIRQHKRSAPVNKIPPAAKSPLEYMKIARKKHG